MTNGEPIWFTMNAPPGPAKIAMGTRRDTRFTMDFPREPAAKEGIPTGTRGDPQ